MTRALTILTDIVGMTASSVRGAEGEDELVFTFPDGKQFKFYHQQDCCESVQIEEVIGDLSDLVGVPLIRAEERVSEDEPERNGRDESNTWTFYEFATIKGSVTVRWLGSSNGYYSEDVSYGWFVQ